MKKLLLILLCLPMIFSSCEKEDDSPTTSGNNNTNLAVGDTLQGGIIFYLDGNGGGLIAALSDHHSPIRWGCCCFNVSGADGTAIGTGYQNTVDIMAACTTSVTTSAAAVVGNLTLGGYSDWFLPSKDELNEMYVNRAIIGGFQDSYWSSTEFDYNGAWKQNFTNHDEENGRQFENLKQNYNQIRAIRAF